MILTEPNPILRRRAREVDAAAIGTPPIQKAIEGLKSALLQSPDGIGIAAPQIGVSLRIFIVSEESKFVDNPERRARTNWKQYVYINPVISNFSSKKSEAVEGCLSVPGKYGIVKRPEKIAVEAYDENGRKFSHGASKFFARVIQHETDHLDGILFIDKALRLVEITPDETRL